MPHPPTDEDLLNAFVKSHDEQAFRRLAERYSGLIFHTALRTLNDRALAEDVAQRVLGVLAKKSAQVARGNAPLAAWLHRTTILEAKSARRSESRHHRKKEALMRAPADSSDSNDPAWKDALPHLDAAIDTLPEADRHVLLLHFVNVMTFPEIAVRVGKSAAAVQKQSRRALETLQRILGKRGIALSLGILTAGLTAEMAKAGPVLLIPALSSLGKTTTSVLVVKKSTLAAVGTTLLLCGIPLARQQASISQLESKLSAAARTFPDPRISSKSAVAKNPSMIERLARDLKAQDHDMLRYLAAVDHIESLRDEELIALIRESVGSSLPFRKREIVCGKIFDTLVNRDIEFALNTLMDVVPLAYAGRSETAQNLLVNGLRSFSERDGKRALAWFHDHLGWIRTISQQRGAPDGYREKEARVALSYGLILSDPQAAVALLRPLDAWMLASGLEQFARGREPALRKDATGFIQVARSLFPEKEANDVVADLISVNFANTRFASVDILLEKNAFTAGEIEAILEKAGAGDFERASHAPDDLKKAISEYKAWLESRHTDAIDRRVGESLGKAVKSWSRTSGPIYEAMLKSGELGLGDDAIIGLLETAGFTLGMERSGQLAAMLSDPIAAQELLLRIQTDSVR